jgi:hypothetical protein
MSLFTPTATSSAAAGVGLWAVGWSTLFKLDKIPGIKRFVNKERVLDRMNRNKVVTLLGTEVLNFGMHGVTQATAVTFALGGTIFNVFMIFLVLPIRQSMKCRSTKDILQGK